MSKFTAIASREAAAQEAKRELRAWMLSGMKGDPTDEMGEAALILLIDVHDRLEALTQPSILTESKS